MDADTPFTHARRGRTWTNLAILAGAVLVLIWLNSIGTATLIMAICAMFTFPLVFDLILDRRARFEMDQTQMRWTSSRQSAEVVLARISKVRLDTRWDFSVRATLMLEDGSKLRIPADAMPPHRAFEENLHARGIETIRHHFRAF